MMKSRCFFCVSFLVLMAISAGMMAQRQPLSLAGEWQVKLDPDSLGKAESYFERKFNSRIALPGTLDEAGYGTKTVGADYGILSRRHKYVGPAWYNREIIIPADWKDQEVVLHLERVMWRSEVWVDGKPAGVQDGLGTPHYHRLGRLKPGKHLLSVCVNNDMIYNIGDKGHCYGEYTQIIWNGMIGKIELIPVPAMCLSQVKVWPDAVHQRVKVTFDILNAGNRKGGKLSYRLIDKSDNRVAGTMEEKLVADGERFAHTAILDLPEPVKCWDEFTPELYVLEITLKSGRDRDVRQVTFGFREVSASRSKILVNQQPVFMRGNLDCLHFPLTGYPSCDVAEWERIFRIYKSYGLNQVRFHSWCPPEAAFAAADKVGIFIQAEVLWIDWWMSVVNKDRPEMTTKGLPKGLGHNPSADAFVQAELRRMIDAYGNHPSFTMICIGNELGNSDFDVMEKWIKKLREEDDRRLYSVSTARRVMPVDQYMVTHNIPDVGGTYGLNGRGTDFDLEKNYSRSAIPVIAHELGQAPVYPLWSEITKYTGVLEARNLEELRQSARKNGVEGMDSAFHSASGALQTLLYKAYLENLFRTASCGGFQLLSMTDYSGQGEALVGWLDSFWESKGIVEPEVFRGYCNSVVPLARFAKYVWASGEEFRAGIQVANYGKEDIQNPVVWTLSDPAGEVVRRGKLDASAKPGRLNEVGDMRLALPVVDKAGKYVLTVAVEGTAYRNHWNIWIFPEGELPENDVVVKDCFDEEAEAVLAKGGKVLLLAHRLGRDEYAYPIYFSPLFWSNSFFPGQSNRMLGLYIDDAHRALSGFPTENHTDWQWQSLCRGKAFIVNDYPALRPIVQPISDFHINDRLASVFECRVGKGKLLVCGHDLNGKTLEARQLKSSLLTYMGGSEFNPSCDMDAGSLREMFYRIPEAENRVPAGFENSVLYVSCGERATENGGKAWQKSLDEVRKQAKGADYHVSCDNVWKDSQGKAWTGAEITVEIKTPNGILGDLYVKFEDWNNQGRTGILSLEGRECLLDKPASAGQWVKLFVMREDTNDGKIVFKAKVKNGGNLMISQVALIGR